MNIKNQRIKISFLKNDAFVNIIWLVNRSFAKSYYTSIYEPIMYICGTTIKYLDRLYSTRRLVELWLQG